MAVMRRYFTEETARTMAEGISRGGVEAVVIESPYRGEEERGRWVVEVGGEGFIRSWERVVARYRDGIEVQEG